jgi:hypothetical protein
VACLLLAVLLLGASYPANAARYCGFVMLTSSDQNDFADRFLQNWMQKGRCAPGDTIAIGGASVRTVGMICDFNKAIVKMDRYEATLCAIDYKSPVSPGG